MVLRVSHKRHKFTKCISTSLSLVPCCGYSFLMAGDFEVALLISLDPRADDGAVDCTEILDLSIDHIADAFGFRFNVYGPVIVIEFRFAEGNGIRTGIDGARDRLAVPVHFDHHLIPV